MFGNDTHSFPVGYRLNRVYRDDRYIVGEVLDRPPSPQPPGYEDSFHFFIIDTLTNDYIAYETRQDLIVALDGTNIPPEFELIGRGDNGWVRPF